LLKKGGLGQIQICSGVFATGKNPVQTKLRKITRVAHYYCFDCEYLMKCKHHNNLISLKYCELQHIYECIQCKGLVWSSRLLHWPCSVYGDMASAEVRAFILLALCGAAVKKVSLHLYRTSTLTYRQPIMSMQSYTEPSTLLNNWRGARECGMELNLASACLQRHRNCATPSIRHPRLHFGSNICCLLGSRAIVRYFLPAPSCCWKSKAKVI
jgi:hypothetical protein